MPLAEQADFAEVAAAAEISQHQFAAGMCLGHLDESDADQVEAVGESPWRQITSPLV